VKPALIIFMPCFSLPWFGYFLFLLHSVFEKVLQELDPALKASAVGSHVTVL